MSGTEARGSRGRGSAAGSSDAPPASLPRRAVAAAVVAVSAALAPPPSSAQSAQPAAGDVEVAAGPTAGTVAGSDFDAVGLGAGGELGVRYALSRRLSLGLAGHASWHDADDLDGSLRLLGASLESRYRLLRPGGRRLRPFVGARVGVARWDATEAGEGLTADVGADGLQAGVLAGVAYPLSGRAGLEVTAVGSFLAFGDAEVDATLDGRERDPFVREGSEATGSFLGLRTLLRVRVP